MTLGAECLGDRVSNASPPCPHCGQPEACPAPDACSLCRCPACLLRRGAAGFDGGADAGRRHAEGLGDRQHGAGVDATADSPPPA